MNNECNWDCYYCVLKCTKIEDYDTNDYDT